MSRYSTILVGMLAFVAFGYSAANGEARSSAPQKAEQTAPPMTESDRIPFMTESGGDESPREAPSSAGLIVRAGGALILVIGLLFAGTWAMRKLGFGNASPANIDAPHVSILSTVPMGNGRSIAAIRFGDRVLLVGTTSQSFTLLAEESPEAEQAPGRSVAEMLAEDEDPDFAEFLRTASTNFRDDLGRGGWN